tara:strand:- start:239 stop:1543 length:1305 start_codon:yes stop_codon:yes gene_type:complete
LQKILIHTITNPCTDKIILELFFLKCYRFIKENLGKYEFHLRIDTWQALVGEGNDLLSFAIDDTSNYKSDKFTEFSKEINKTYLDSKNNIKKNIDEIVKENKYFTNLFSSIKVSSEFNDFGNYCSHNHFNLIGNIFKDNHTEYDFYIFKSINSIVSDKHSLSKTINHLNTTNIPFVYTSNFFNILSYSNSILQFGVDPLNLFVIKNDTFFKYLKEIDNDSRITISYPNGETLKLSETFLFGISDWFPSKIENNTIPTIRYKGHNFSDFVVEENHIDVNSFDILKNYIHHNTFPRRCIEAGPFLLELILLMYYKKTINKNFNTITEFSNIVPDELHIPIARFNQHKQNFWCNIKVIIQVLSKNDNTDISKLRYLLKEIDDLNLDLKLLLEFSIDMGVNIDTELLEFQEEYDTTFLDRTRACINEIIKKNMNLILN